MISVLLVGYFAIVGVPTEGSHAPPPPSIMFDASLDDYR
jgi:hypothetical protein